MGHRKTTITFYNEKGKITEIYRINGAPIDTMHKIQLTEDALGDTTSVEIYKYNTAGNLCEIEKYAPKDSLNSKTEFKYDHKGSKTEEMKFGQDGFLEMKRVFDFNGRKARRKLF